MPAPRITEERLLQPKATFPTDPPNPSAFEATVRRLSDEHAVDATALCAPSGLAADVWAYGAAIHALRISLPVGGATRAVSRPELPDVVARPGKPYWRFARFRLAWGG